MIQGLIPTLIWMAGLAGSASGSVGKFVSNSVVSNPTRATDEVPQLRPAVAEAAREWSLSVLPADAFARARVLAVSLPPPSFSLNTQGTSSVSHGIEPSFGHRLSPFGMNSASGPVRTDRPFPIDPDGDQVPAAPAFVLFVLAGCSASRRRRD